MRGWAYTAWHTGMNLETYMALPLYDRWLVHDELNELVLDANEAGAPHPKDMK